MGSEIGLHGFESCLLCDIEQITSQNIHKMRVVIISTSQGCCEDRMEKKNTCKALRTMPNAYLVLSKC